MRMKQTTSFRPKWRVLTSYVAPWSSPESLMERAGITRRVLVPYGFATFIVAGLTVIFWKIGYAFTLVNLALLYLLPVLICAVRWGLSSAFYAACIGVVAFDYFFVPPIHTFTVSDIRYFMSFAVYLAVAAFTASLASQLRHRAKEAREREVITSALYALSTQVAAARDLDTMMHEIVRHAASTFGLSAAILLPDTSGNLEIRAQYGFESEHDADIVEPRILRWVYDHGKMAGYGTHIQRDTSKLYVPLKTESKTYGVMCVSTEQPPQAAMANNLISIVQALAGLASVSIARIHFEEEAKVAHLTAESERLRTALLDSISHELRTPLATIIGAVTGMIESENMLSPQDQHELLLTIRDGAMRMNRLVTNLLGMVRLESGMLHLNRKWCDVSDIVGVALRQVQDSLQNRTVELHLQKSLPAVAVDDVLIEQVLVNLLSNAIKYSPDGRPIQIDVMEYDGVLTIRIRDRGIGIDPEDVEKIFDKFYRTPSGQNIPGTGLGLAICRGLIQAHGGEIFARPADDQGTVMTIRLPVGEPEKLPN